MTMLRMLLSKILFYWRYTLIILLAFISLNTIPVIIKGVADGNNEALRTNVIEAKKGEYVLKAYSNGDYTRSLITTVDIYNIDKILREKLPEIYEGYTPFLRGELFLSIESSGYRSWIEADESIENDVAYISNSFAADKSVKRVGYRYSESSGFYTDIEFIRAKFEYPYSSNPLLDCKNSLFFYYPDIKASFETTRKMLGYPPNSNSGIVLHFSSTPLFSELEEILSDFYIVWRSEALDDTPYYITKNKTHTIETVLSFDDLDNDLISLTERIIDNGQVTSFIKEIDTSTKQANNLVVFFSIILPIIVFITVTIELESRKKEIKLGVSLGGRTFKILLDITIEKLLLAFLSIVISLLIIVFFYFSYRNSSLKDPIEIVFTLNNLRVFCFDHMLFIKLSMISILVSILSSSLAVLLFKKEYIKC